MQEVFIKIEHLKTKISKLLHAYNNLKEDNNIFKKRVVFLEDTIEKQKDILNRSENMKSEDLKRRIEEYIGEIDEVIKLLS